MDEDKEDLLHIIHKAPGDLILEITFSESCMNPMQYLADMYLIEKSRIMAKSGSVLMMRMNKPDARKIAMAYEGFRIKGRENMITDFNAYSFEDRIAAPEYRECPVGEEFRPDAADIIKPGTDKGLAGKLETMGGVGTYIAAKPRAKRSA